jgi:hypothetical protein
MEFKNQYGPWIVVVEAERPHTPRLIVTRQFIDLPTRTLVSSEVVRLWWTDRWWVRVKEGRRIELHSWEDALTLVIQICSLLATPTELRWLQSNTPIAPIITLYLQETNETISDDPGSA